MQHRGAKSRMGLGWEWICGRGEGTNGAKKGVSVSIATFVFVFEGTTFLKLSGPSTLSDM